MGVPIKKTPPIVDIIEEIVKKEPEITTIDSKTTIEPTVPIEHVDIKNKVEENSDPIEDLIPSEPIEIQDNIVQNEVLNNVTPEISTDDFSAHWGTLFDTIFSHTPTIYYPLKGYVPKIKGNLIYIDLKNEIQKEHFEPKIREILSYLRTHFNERIEDVLVNVDETIVTKKIIYDTVDKMKNLNEQNSNFEEFSAILDLKVKE